MRPLTSLLVLLLSFAPLVVHAQHAGHSGTPPQLSLFDRLVGQWEGDAWIVRGPEGRQTVRQHETVEAVAGGTVFTIKGLGKLQESGGDDRVVHDAFAVVFLDHDHLTPKMRAFVADGARWIDPEIALSANGYSWTMRDPRIGVIRYDMTFDAQGRWVEKGVMSRDEGKTWVPFFEMTLTKQR